MMTTVEAGARVSGKSDIDMTELFWSMVAYSGRWLIDGEVIVWAD